MIILSVKLRKNYNVSRQAIYDNIKRTESMMEDYERKLGLFQKFKNGRG